MGLMDILSGGMNLLDLPASMIRDTLGGANPFDQLASPFQYENRLDGRDVLENWGLLGQNQEGFDLGDVAGFAADVVMDPFTLGALGRKIAGVGTKAAAKAFGKNVATDAAVFAPIMAGAYGINPQTQWSLPMMAGAYGINPQTQWSLPMMAGAYGINPQTQWSLPMMAGAYGINPQTQWSLPGAAGAGDAVNAAIGLPRAIQGPMTPWAAMGHNRKVQQMLDAGAMPADVARQTRAKVVDPSLYDHLQGSAPGSADFEQLQKMQSDWEGPLRSQLEEILSPEELENALSMYSPARLYHGTPHDYFDRVDLSKTSPRGLAGRGFYTTNMPEVGNSYVNKGRLFEEETLKLSPEMYREKLSQKLEELGLQVNPDTPYGLGKDLSRYLSGEWNPGQSGAEALSMRLAVPHLLRSDNPLMDMAGNTVSDPGRVADIIRELRGVKTDASLFEGPQRLHVQRLMMDSRSPFDLDAALPNPSGKDPRGVLEDVVKQIPEFTDQPVDVSKMASDVDSYIAMKNTAGEALPRELSVNGVSFPSVLFNKRSKEGIEGAINDLVNVSRGSDSDGFPIMNPSGQWATKQINYIKNRFGIKDPDDVAKLFESAPQSIKGFRDAVGGAVDNYANMAKAGLADARHSAKIDKGGIIDLAEDLVSDLHPLAITGDNLSERAYRVYKAGPILHQIDLSEVAPIYQALDQGERSVANQMISRLIDRSFGNPHYITADDKVGVAESIRTLYAIDKRLGNKGTGVSAEAVEKFKEQLPALFEAVNPSHQMDNMIFELNMRGDEFLEKISGHHTEYAINEALRQMRGADPVGWDVLNAMFAFNRDTTDQMFRSLGHDALTHTGGQRSGNGELLHRVFIGLDPDKIYKGHSIAPDPVDVWTLQNVLTGMPAMSVPTRAMWAESRSAPGM